MIKKLILFSALLLAIPACSTLPNTGPSVSNISRYEGAQVIPVDATMARTMRQEFLYKEEKVRSANLLLLSTPVSRSDYRLQPGDKVTMTLVTWTLQTANPTSADHTFNLSADGSVDIPFAKGKVVLSDMTIPQAQEYIKQIYIKRRIFLQPSVQLTLEDQDANHGVLVTGATGNPKMVPWSAGGLSLAQVLTKTTGNAQIIGLQQNALNGGTSATSVTIIRKGMEKISIPVDVALESDIPLWMDDKIIVSHKPAVQVTVMGGGISNGLYDFAQHPSLAQVVAQAKGLNPQTANAKSVYVFRNGPEPKLYSFAFKTTDAQFAAQQFPLMDADIVYVAEAGIVQWQSVMQSIWPLATIASIAK